MDKQTEQATNTQQLPTILNDRHKRVVDNLLMGMGKAKAYQSIYPRCKSNQAAWSQVKNIMARPECIAYYESELEHKQRFIDKSNCITVDQAASLNKSAISQLQRIADKCEAKQDYGIAITAISNMAKVVDNAAKQTGIGAYDPTIREQIALKKRALKQQEKLQDDNDKEQQRLAQDNSTTIQALTSIIESD